eukprot:UN21521
MTVITNKGVIGDDHRVLLILLDNFDDSVCVENANMTQCVRKFFLNQNLSPKDFLTKSFTRMIKLQSQFWKNLEAI